MSTEQQLALDANLRQGELDLSADVPALRAGFNEVMARIPVAGDVEQRPTSLGVSGVEVTIRGVDAAGVILYFHGGVYVIGSAVSTVPLVSDLARRARVKAVTLDYRLAPEHPYPAAADDAVAAYEGLLDQGIDPGQIALAGESAGGGLAIATLLALRDAGRPLPCSAYVMSPYVDLTLSGDTLPEKQAVDPILSPEGLRLRDAGLRRRRRCRRSAHQSDLRRSPWPPTTAHPGWVARDLAQRRASSRGPRGARRRRRHTRGHSRRTACVPRLRSDAQRGRRSAGTRVGVPG